MKEKKNYVKDWLNSGTKKEVFVKKIFITVMTIYIIYQLGYGIGTFVNPQSLVPYPGAIFMR